MLLSRCCLWPDIRSSRNRAIFSREISKALSITYRGGHSLNCQATRRYFNGNETNLTLYRYIKKKAAALRNKKRFENRYSKSKGPRTLNLFERCGSIGSSRREDVSRVLIEHPEIGLQLVNGYFIVIR